MGFLYGFLGLFVYKRFIDFGFKIVVFSMVLGFSN